jgi:protein-S-isoprenylcysteine O-methyltransferase Ste14
MRSSRLAFDDALTVWRARDVHRVQSCCRGLVVLFFCLEFLTGFLVGPWWVGPVLVAVHGALFWCLRWALRWTWRWAHRGLWWCIDRAQEARGR